MKIPLMIVSSILLLAACSESETQQPIAASPPKPAATKPLCEIDENSIAGIPLGTTLAQVHELFPQANVSTETDAEGATFFAIKLNPTLEVLAYTEEHDKADSPISYLETQSKICQTPEGVHPEMLVNDVAKKYGEVEQIMLSEIEARQTVEFAAQPPEFSFRIDDTGIFDENDKTYPQISSAYQENAKIISIAIMDLPAEENETASALAK